MLQIRRATSAAVVIGCFLLSTSSPLLTQESVRRSTDSQETLDQREQRLKSLSRLLWNQSRNLNSVEVDEAEILVHCGKVTRDSVDYLSLDALKDGDVLMLTLAASTKLRTEADLRFGNTAIPTGNVAEGFAGTYSLWIRRVSDGWHLIFNNEADVWGTQRDPSRDFEEISLTYEANDDPAEEMKILVTEADGLGVLSILWGDHRWSADFVVIEG
jgi:hypothetical protein